MDPCALDFNTKEPKPLEGQLDISLGTVDSMKAGNNHDSVPDDRKAALNAILDAGAIIISTPTCSLQFVKHKLPETPNLPVSNSIPDCRNRESSASWLQYTMALPSLHILVYPLHAKVVDQFIGQGVSTRGAIFLHPELMERARQLGWKHC